MPEQALIDILARCSPARGDVVLGIGDDAALTRLPDGEYLVSCCDTLNEGVHFSDDDDAADIGWKSLAVNLSDIAAMGATPRWALLSLTLPEPDTRWVEDFSAGFSELAQQHDLALIGGDMTRGPRAICVTVLGSLAGEPARRGTAAPGDPLAVTGTLGAAALALRLGRRAPTALTKRLHRPQPLIEAGCALRGQVTAMMDVSDGLLADLPRLLGGLGARVQVDRVPTAPEFDAHAGKHRLQCLLAGGEDYELLMSLPAADADAILARHPELTVIGEVHASPDIVWCEDDHELDISKLERFDHF